jgi:RNA-binding protein
MKLSESHKKFLRGLGHALKPVVTIGDAGVSEPLLKEFDTSIRHHELIKVKVRASNRAARDAAIDILCERGAADLIARIGNVALLYRRNDEKPQIRLPGR